MTKLYNYNIQFPFRLGQFLIKRRENCEFLYHVSEKCLFKFRIGLNNYMILLYRAQILVAGC